MRGEPVVFVVPLVTFLTVAVGVTVALALATVAVDELSVLFTFLTAKFELVALLLLLLPLSVLVDENLVSLLL